MRVNPHLEFDGRCEAAFTFYEKTLGGKIVFMMRHEDSLLAKPMPPDWGNKIVHAMLVLDEDRLIGAEVAPEQYQKPRGFSILLNLSTLAEADRIFTTLADTGTVEVALQETFWALRFGALTDQFGTPWSINCGKQA